MDTEQAVDYMRLTGRWWELDTLDEVAQAVGMIAAQLECPLHDAATVLRGHTTTHAHTQSTADIARDVVARNLSFAP